MATTPALKNAGRLWGKCVTILLNNGLMFVHANSTHDHNFTRVTHTLMFESEQVAKKITVFITAEQEQFKLECSVNGGPREARDSPAKLIQKFQG